ncbi:unnamed protein product [Periconia digitata]|uniref:Cytochrome b561 domain-containing protein n=1 Tax=Periconia digitata TaxID=1303443 RepID=A0A9W4UI51_9PLEO|nr:unnamed protein product [Periconia digitata]
MLNNVTAVLLGLASIAAAQYGPNGQYGPGSSGGNPFAGSGGDGSSGFSGSGFGNFDLDGFMRQGEKRLIAHGVLASLAFVIFFPMGSILIRLGSFRGLWIVHGLFQIFAYIVYIAAFGLGIYIVRSIPVDMLGHHHPIIGIVVFCLLFFQPILGFLHHYAYRKYERRTVWSYGHLWLGRIVITLGIINGGLGMLLATDTGFYAPSTGQKIAYGVVAGVMWLAWVLSSVIGERRRARAHRSVESRAKGQYA